MELEKYEVCGEDCFWQFDPATKWNVLKEPRHHHLIIAALEDRCTGIERVDRHTYMVYGEEEALLLRPTTLVMRIALELYAAFLRHVQ